MALRERLKRHFVNSFVMHEIEPQGAEVFISWSYMSKFLLQDLVFFEYTRERSLNLRGLLSSGTRIDKGLLRAWSPSSSGSLPEAKLCLQATIDGCERVHGWLHTPATCLRD